jgi:phage terminase large subunit GpA-like protein
MLSPEASAESGRWETSKAEYQREMMDALTDPRIDEITLMKSVRTGGTQAVIDNAVGYWIDQDPGPILVVQPGKNEGRTWSKDHFDPMVRDTPCLRGKVHSDKIKDRKNEILHKNFPGGVLYIIGSNSAAGFRQKTIQRVLLDDVDGYETSAGGEGDQIELARNRTITYLYHHRKIVKVSNPTTRGLSRIEAEYLTSDQRHFYVPCPECRFSQLLIFSPRSQFSSLSGSYLRFDKENLSWCYYECQNCHAKLEERVKLAMIRSGKWIALKPEVTNHAGFHLNELVSPFSSWNELAKGFLGTKKLKERLRVFINQRLGETFEEEKSIEIDEDSLLKRVEKYEHVPSGALVLTAAVDIQVDRLEATVEGWGLNFENWFIDRRIIIGSPDRSSTWAELDAFLATERKHESGLALKPWTSNGLACVTVDSGYSTQNAYSYVKARQMKRFFAVKGEEGSKREFIIKVHYNNKQRARLAIIGVDAIKTRIMDRLAIEKPGPGFMHFPDRCKDDYFRQLTAEKRVIVRDAKGFMKYVWKLKEGERNEMLDCKVYNLAAIELLRPNFEALKAKLDEKIVEMRRLAESAADDDEPIRTPAKPVMKSRRAPRRPGSWDVNG